MYGPAIAAGEQTLRPMKANEAKCVAISPGEVAEPNVVRTADPTRLPDVRPHCGHSHGSKRDTETHPEMLVMCVASG